MPRRARTLADLGESALIERIARRAGHAPGRDWVLAIGDDAAILRPGTGEELVWTTDAQVEAVHFRLGRETPRTIGRQAMAANLSDLAAMGARPVGALLSLAAPKTARLSDFDAVIAGLVEEGDRFGCPLVGGNLSRAEVWHLHVSVVGACAKGRALRRRGLRPGNGLYVTGTLGGAALARLRADRTDRSLRRVSTPRIDAGRALARLAGTRACIDVSDGLATDLGHLLEEGGCGAQLEPERLPRPRGFDRACGGLGLDPLRVIAGGGEDYELLFAFDAGRISDPTRKLSAKLGVPVTRIGRITREPGIQGLPPAGRGHHF